MKYHDVVYGDCEIGDPVILDLMQSSAMQRLKGVDSGGHPEPFFTSGQSHSRFEHSMGVYVLLKKYNAPLEEQIAGLIHDLSHSAFSHAIDYILDEGSEKQHNHQDNVFDDYVRSTEVPAILEKHGFDVGYILDDRNFPLKENNLPDICADRIDYSLRIAELRLKTKTQAFLEHLFIQDNKWVFDSYEWARKFAELFTKLNREDWSSIVTAQMYCTTGEVMRHALQKGYITKQDLYTTNQGVLDKITPHLSEDAELQKLWDRMNNKVKITNNPKDFDEHVFVKSRVVDPLCQHEGKLKRVSDIDPEWGKIVEQEMKPKEYWLKFEKVIE